MPSRSHRLHIEPSEYRAKDGRSISAERGRLSVPVRRDQPGGQHLELAFARLPASDSVRAGAPTVFLTGGPGLSAIASGRGRLFGLFQSLRATGDVILLDQRGCGLSTPSLACDHPLEFPIEQPVTRGQFTAAAIDAMRRCAAVLLARGIDLAGFNSNESADDVAELVRALGYERANLLGWSYGSHLAMAVMRRHTDVLERVVLAGPEGPDQTWKLPSRVHAQLDRLSARAGFDATRAVRAALDQAERRPPRLPWGDGRTAALGRFDVEWLLAESLADTRTLRRLPAVLSNMASGDFMDVVTDPLLRGMLETFRGGLFRSPVRYCADCASGISYDRWQRIQKEAEAFPLGRTLDWPFPEICEAFGNTDLGDAFRARLRSHVKVLFITGTLDCRTPHENVPDLAPGFLSPRHFVVEDAGHSDLLLPPVVHAAVTEFLHSGYLDASHASAEPFVPDPPRATLVYDGDCPFCRKQVEQLKRQASERMEFIPYQSVGERFPDVPREDFAREVHLVQPDGTVVTGAKAVLAAAADHSRLARAALAGTRAVPGFGAAAEAVYRLVARNRHRLSR